MFNKKIFFYWAGEKMSWMRFISIVSFKLQNPTWDVELYIPKNVSNFMTKKTWYCDVEQDFFKYNGEDYFNRLEKFDIKIKQCDIYYDDTDQVRNSDIFRWNILSSNNTFYSDADILFVKPVDEIFSQSQQYNILVGYNGYFLIGFMASSGNNSFFSDVFDISKRYRENSDYQTSGALIFYGLLGSEYNDVLSLNHNQYISSLHKMIKRIGNENFVDLFNKKYPDIKMIIHPFNAIYPYQTNELNRLYESKEESLPDITVGVHWFGGHPLSQKYNNIMNENTYKKIDNTFSFWAKKIMEKL